MRAGESLSSIASSLYGDASLWYKIAQANGLAGDGGLTVGQTLILPMGVTRSTYNAATFKPYDPAEAIGDTSPTTPVQPKPPKKNKCGVVGQILLVVIAVAVTLITYNPATGQGVLASLGAAHPIAASAVAGATGSIASQTVGVATGIQQKFSWNAVALAGIGAGAGGALGNSFSNVSNAAVRAGAQAVAGNVITQGVGVATGLQKKFSWAGVAAAGIGGLIPGGMGPFGVGSVVARTLANAATRSLIEGTDFGDNVLAALPDVLGQTIGEAIAGGIQQAQERGRLAASQANRILDAIDPNGQLAPDARQAAVAQFRASFTGASSPAQRDAAINQLLSVGDQRTVSAFRELVAPSPTVSGPPDPGDVVVTAARKSNFTFGELIDRSGIFIGDQKAAIGASINGFLDKTPAARVALNVASLGLVVLGGPVRYIEGLGWSAVQDKVQGAVTGALQQNWSPESARSGGDGITFAGSTIFGTVIIGRMRGPEVRDYQPTRARGLRGDIEANLSGRRSTADRTPSTHRQENEVADMLAQNGYRIEQNPTLSAVQRDRFGIPSRDPDYLIEGRPFDLYGPNPGANAASIAMGIGEKTNPALRQADRIIVDLRGTSVTRGQLQSYIRSNPPIAGLNELRVVTTDWLGNPVIRTIRQ